MFSEAARSKKGKVQKPLSTLSEYTLTTITVNPQSGCQLDLSVPTTRMTNPMLGSLLSSPVHYYHQDAAFTFFNLFILQVFIRFISNSWENAFSTSFFSAQPLRATDTP